jgi:hypothetical protein
MGAVLAFLGTFLLSLFVALLAGLQLADHFRATEEFVAVIILTVVYAVVAILLFALASASARTTRPLTALAWLLAAAAVLLVLVPNALGGRRFQDFITSPRDRQIVLEFLLPVLLAVLVQWGLVRRRWLRTHRLEDLTRWPWFTTMVVGLAVLNPIGLDWIEAALRRPVDWPLRQTQALATIAAAVAVIVAAALEYYIRDRMLRRRTNPSPAGATLRATR